MVRKCKLHPSIIHLGPAQTFAKRSYRAICSARQKTYIASHNNRSNRLVLSEVVDQNNTSLLYWSDPGTWRARARQTEPSKRHALRPPPYSTPINTIKQHHQRIIFPTDKRVRRYRPLDEPSAYRAIFPLHPAAGMDVAVHRFKP